MLKNSEFRLIALLPFKEKLLSTKNIYDHRLKDLNERILFIESKKGKTSFSINLPNKKLEINRIYAEL